MDVNDPQVQKVIAAARESRKVAYAPYSGFKMGAAIGTDTGAVVCGTLVENVSLGLAMCAERVALFKTVVDQAGTPELLVLFSPKTAGAITWPCGACLQVARELAGSELMVLVTDGDDIEFSKLSELAPRLPAKDG